MSTSAEKAGIAPRLLSMEDLKTYTGLGETKAREWAREIGAEKHIGRRALYDREIIDDALQKIGPRNGGTENETAGN